MILLTVNICTT